MGISQVLHLIPLLTFETIWLPSWNPLACTSKLLTTRSLQLANVRLTSDSMVSWKPPMRSCGTSTLSETSPETLEKLQPSCQSLFWVTTGLECINIIPFTTLLERTFSLETATPD